MRKAPSQVVSLRLPAQQARRLKRLARRLGKTSNETGAQLLDEALRQSEFAWIEFRNSPIGRQAYIQGSSLAVWEVAFVAQHYQMDSGRTAAHLHWPVAKVQAALNYAEAFSEEIQLAIEDNREADFSTLKRLMPALEPVEVRAKGRARA